jgi:GNAT superfamily N-acetyltransferase
MNNAEARPSSTAVTIRPLDYERDPLSLSMFLNERDRLRLEHMQPAIEGGDCFAFVADDGSRAVGWAVVHTNFREDQDWTPPDDDTIAFQSGDNAYLENIEVTARFRGTGVGSQLIEAAQAEARRRRKRRLWLHTSENNAKAHTLFDRSGWVHERTVVPPWKPGSRTRIYRKDL